MRKRTAGHSLFSCPQKKLNSDETSYTVINPKQPDEYTVDLERCLAASLSIRRVVPAVTTDLSFHQQRTPSPTHPRATPTETTSSPRRMWRTGNSVLYGVCSGIVIDMISSSARKTSSISF